MDLEVIIKICNELNSVTSDIKWEDHLCFNVGGKMFYIASLGNTPTSSSFKVNEAEFEYLIEKEGIIPAPYLAKYKWVRIDDIRRIPEKEWEKYIKNSYYLVASKLSKKLQKEIGVIK